MPDAAPKVSVALSTYQRAGLLPRLIQALEEQTLPPDEFEVVVTDNASTDDTARTLTSLAARSSLNLRITTAPRNRGPAPGRNLAWRQGTAPVVAFIDDDCVPAPQWLEAGLQAMENGARLVIGTTLPNPAHEHLRKYPFAKTITQEEGARFFNACNIFYLRKDLEQADGFDEGFTTPGGEDTDLALRVIKLGAEPTFISEALVYHDVRPSSFGATARETLRWTDIPRFFRLHPEARAPLLRRGVFWKESHPRVLAAAAGLMLSPRYRAALALTVPWLWFRLRMQPLCPGPRRRVLALPGAFAIDALEVIVMVRGSLRHRTVVL